MISAKYWLDRFGLDNVRLMCISSKADGLNISMHFARLAEAIRPQTGEVVALLFLFVYRPSDSPCALQGVANPLNQICTTRS